MPALALRKNAKQESILLSHISQFRIAFLNNPMLALEQEEVLSDSINKTNRAVLKRRLAPFRNHKIDIESINGRRSGMIDRGSEIHCLLHGESLTLNRTRSNNCKAESLM